MVSPKFHGSNRVGSIQDDETLDGDADEGEDCDDYNRPGLYQNGRRYTRPNQIGMKDSFASTVDQ